MDAKFTGILFFIIFLKLLVLFSFLISMFLFNISPFINPSSVESEPWTVLRLKLVNYFWFLLFRLQELTVCSEDNVDVHDIELLQYINVDCAKLKRLLKGRFKCISAVNIINHSIMNIIILLELDIKIDCIVFLWNGQ